MLNCYRIIKSAREGKRVLEENRESWSRDAASLEKAAAGVDFSPFRYKYSSLRRHPLQFGKSTRVVSTFQICSTFRIREKFEWSEFTRVFGKSFDFYGGECWSSLGSWWRCDGFGNWGEIGNLEIGKSSKKSKVEILFLRNTRKSKLGIYFITVSLWMKVQWKWARFNF